jgi:serine-type D-Ala-D-Ala carboxypeptidase/endopeptidase (penicillin-binding protein 4)
VSSRAIASIPPGARRPLPNMAPMIAAFFAAVVLAAGASPSDPDIQMLARVVNALASAYPMDTARLGVSVVDTATGRVLFERDANNEFAPASNFKLLDAAAALAFLGTQFRYRTDLYARGPLSGDTLQGDLVLVGGGDPVLARDDLRRAAAEVTRMGIRRIAGTVLVDDSYFDEQRYGGDWAWDDLPYYYQPPVQALSVDEGVANVTVTPGSEPGARVAASIEPNGGMMSIVSDAVTTPAGGTNDVDCFRSPGSRTIVIVGHYPADAQPFTFGCAVENSALYAAAVFTQLLRDGGVSIGRAPIGKLPSSTPLDIEVPAPESTLTAARYADARLIWSHQSPTLAQLLAHMMPPSDNFIADHLFKTLPVVALHQRGTFDGGATVERSFVSLLGLDARSIDNGDGSGLSQGDRITPHDLAEILLWETRSSTGDFFMRSLAQAGINGTVKHRLSGSDAVGRVRAKDGYIWHVSTLSGYADTLHHGTIVFCIMFNDANGSIAPFFDAEDKIVETIVDWP